MQIEIEGCDAIKVAEDILEMEGVQGSYEVISKVEKEGTLATIATIIGIITGLPPYRNTKKLTKPLLQVASQKKLKRRYWVHFPFENGCTVDCI
ncbi:MAG: hypothetical protein IM500_13230 [Microcystis sp. M179S2]|uniref:hypothetical protein n=1 Tax=Microcystis sp. M179S2 TaxID=2771160 RepID=UPI002587FCB7|nr:hypothetical protein [Microcystis sp. M179S2]MCA2701351.1 hypothetical protein [Microcystis sp. M179S2]